MTFALASQFNIYLPKVNAHLAKCLNTVLNVKTLVGAFNQKKDCENRWIICSSRKRKYLQCVHNSGNVQS